MGSLAPTHQNARVWALGPKHAPGLNDFGGHGCRVTNSQHTPGGGIQQHISAHTDTLNGPNPPLTLISLLLVRRLTTSLTIFRKPHSHSAQSLEDGSPALSVSRLGVLALYGRRQAIIVIHAKPQQQYRVALAVCMHALDFDAAVVDPFDLFCQNLLMSVVSCFCLRPSHSEITVCIITRCIIALAHMQCSAISFSPVSDRPVLSKCLSLWRRYRQTYGHVEEMSHACRLRVQLMAW